MTLHWRYFNLFYLTELKETCFQHHNSLGWLPPALTSWFLFTLYMENKPTVTRHRSLSYKYTFPFFLRRYGLSLKGFLVIASPAFNIQRCHNCVTLRERDVPGVIPGAAQRNSGKRIISISFWQRHGMRGDFPKHIFNVQTCKISELCRIALNNPEVARHLLNALPFPWLPAKSQQCLPAVPCSARARRNAASWNTAEGQHLQWEVVSLANCYGCAYVGNHIIQLDFTADGNKVTWAYTGS